MPDTATAAKDARIRLGRATSNMFRLLFGLSVVIAAGATYLAVTDTSPSAAGQPGLFWLLIANLVLIAGVATVLGVRVYSLVRENRETNGGARLRLRIIFLFSLTAAIPTILVAGFLAVAINRSVDGWFSRPVTNIVQGGKEAARAAMDDLRNEVEREATSIYSDIAASAPPADGSQPPINALADYLQRRSSARGLFSRVELLDSAGAPHLPALADPNEAPPSVKPTQKDWDAANVNEINVREDADGAIRVFFKAPIFDNVYVQMARSIPPQVNERFQQADASLKAFEEAQARRQVLSTVLVLSYVEAAALMLLGTAWLGMTAAARIAMPIGALAGAARAVRDGDLSVRLLRPQVRDEIADLADAFNEMTDRQARQTSALDRARIDAETRSAFIEAVLSGVEAGVIRIDGDLHVTIANASAQSLLSFVHRPGSETPLAKIAPEFVSAARRAIETGQSVDTSFKRSSENGTLHLQVRVAPEADRAGAVITFHDTTRLVMGQRQAAWRDVARRIAHEIRNPLTPIQLSAERLKRRFASQITTDRETFERCTDTITRQVADIGRMVEEFSGFARMPKPTFGKFGLVDMVESVAFAQRMSTPSITVTVTAPPHPVEVLGDERMLAQALTNIVKNAAEAVERQIEGGGLSKGSVAIDVFTDADEVQLTIRDNGPGFPVADRERLLEPYVTTRKNGVGLGLAIVTRIVEDHGGRIWLGDNELAANGARVDIRMPMQPNPVQESGPVEESMALSGGGVA
ncbi:MAG: HAMP domain-containing protein [Hyphomonadaceae bacterium]|nr:HAMP domain-containing protein [Hyphomonadaceae bacterium]